MSIEEKLRKILEELRDDNSIDPIDSYASEIIALLSPEQPVERTALECDVEEYLHWRKVNPQIKGGENYLKRLRQSLSAPMRESGEEWKPQYDWPRSGLDIVRSALSQNNVYFQGKNGDVYRVWLDIDMPRIELVKYDAALPTAKIESGEDDPFCPFCSSIKIIQECLSCGQTYDYRKMTNEIEDGGSK